MNLEAPFDSITIILNKDEQKILAELIQLQENQGDFKKSIGPGEAKRVCNVEWKRLKSFVMTGDRNCKILKIPLSEHSQLLLQRYIDAEKQEPDFIARGLSKMFQYHVYFYFYYAGHGC